jgi:hypothetical protein
MKYIDDYTNSIIIFYIMRDEVHFVRMRSIRLERDPYG